jgi:hypothetical protein
LQTAEAVIECNMMARADGIQLPDKQPITHFARELTVLVWWPQRVA